MRPGTTKNLIAAACYSGVFILGMVFGPKFVRDNRRPGALSPATAELAGDKKDRILDIIRQKYVDEVTVDTLGGGSIPDLLKKLDPHSAYLPPENAESLGEDLEGSFNGIGISYYLLNDSLLVTLVNPDGPSAHSGLGAGDRILAVDGRAVSGVHIEPKAITRLIRGVQGSGVELLVLHPGTSIASTIRVTRGKVTVSSIDAAYLLQPATGYIKISRFGARTVPDFVQALQRLKKAGLQNLVLDLRGNGGGYLSAATALADEFIGNKKLIVYTEGQHEPRTDYLATEQGNFEHGKLAVLIDESTASASEIVAGAIQDLDRGTIIGRRSFGKGLVQEQFPFDDGSALNLTIARYYTPSGRSIQRSYKNGAEAYYEEPLDRYHGRKDATRDIDSLYNRKQLYRTSSGRKVYGGGGIRPDLYVAPDTAGFTPYYARLSASGFLNDFVYTRLARHKPATVDAFIKDFRFDDQSYAQFTRLAAEKGIKATDSITVVTKPAVAAGVKAILALYYFGDDGYYRVINARDPVLATALEALR